MSDTFTASNGKRVATESEEGDFTVGYMPLTGKEVAALREFFQHERDQELGRWRAPESPNLVVYARDGDEEVRVLDERAGWAWKISPSAKIYETSVLYDVVKAGHAYFAAHPEPKPWHDAKPGEVWAITTENVADEVAVQVTPESTFQYNDGYDWPIRDMPIVTARRIFPEVKP